MKRSEKAVEQFDRLIDWDVSLTPRDEFMDRVFSDDPLRIKYGADITASTLHIGHAVNLRVMRQMQDLGHKVVFLLGGFTTLVGDPTDKLQARKAPDLADMQKNQEAFTEQIKTVVRFDDPELIEVRNNTEWWGGVETPGTLTILDFFRLLGDVTLNQLLARDMFRNRQEQGKPIQMSEFLYPVLQGYDSVMMQSDITVVGSDQLFNESMARPMQAKVGQNKQMIVCTKVTPGLDGGPKQSKSIGNYVGIAHSPSEMFGRLMKLQDHLSEEWLEVYSNFTIAEIEDIVKGEENPLEIKRKLARNVTEMFHGLEAAEIAESTFDKKLSGKAPHQVETITFTEGDSLNDVLRALGYKSGNIKQFIKNGSLNVIVGDNEFPINDYQELAAMVEEDQIIKIGKRTFFKAVNDNESQ